jgi:hypothetical protein
MDEYGPRVPMPVPDLAPRPITFEQYEALTPEKLELVRGFLIWGPDHPEPSVHLLSLLLTNVGLDEAVKLAPRERWEAALRSAYPAG